ncbi:MAG: signal peptidase II [Sphaerochaetaceae bacterium]|nr:signal peptidase II [Sphaerochaetaceae bacterium]MDC7236336.1 signal peptidase II [Sphaerochaetaceae bacterium]MDC7249314.1 signal peptidase II [Sphaerochaetaceae bacterium]
MKKYKHLLLSVFIVIVDQISKSFIVANVKLNTIGYSFFNDFLQIIHVRNNAVAFSLGTSLSLPIRTVLFIFLPIVVLIYIFYLMYYEKELQITNFQRWLLAGFIGGGLGNLIDRIFRSFQVVDFMSNKVYGLFGLERWPTWNFADASVVVCGVLMLISIIYGYVKNNKKAIK